MQYWHMQMHLPNGREGDSIDSIEMLMLPNPVIGTTEWENFQCENFKTAIQIGDVVCVHEGNTIIGLCRVVSDLFEDENLRQQFRQNIFRKVEVLELFQGDEKFPQPQGTLQRLVNQQSQSWKFVDEWYKKIEMSEQMKQLIDTLTFKKQVILQGPPGTGKTYSAKDMAEKLIFGEVSLDRKEQKRRLEDSEQFQLTQFHPSYSYEDFVRGIEATSHDGVIAYETKDKILASFAKRANTNLTQSQLPLDQVGREQYVLELLMDFADKVQEEIDANGPMMISNAVGIVRVEKNSFYYKGENWPNALRMRIDDLVKIEMNHAYTRQEVRKVEGISRTGIEHASYFHKLSVVFRERYQEQLSRQSVSTTPKMEVKPYVLIVDEINRANLPSVLGELIYALEYRGEAVESMYALDGDHKLVLPENLYIIGTMNTADRSVGHIDYAIRRRFAFIDMLPNSEIISQEVARELFYEVSKLFVMEENGGLKNSVHLSPDFDYKEIQLGHSYFMSKEISSSLEYEIKPILREYVKDGVLLSTALELIEALHVDGE
ncbi:AAA family ATPase [Halosquirtibacter laminarini]|uniref:AAA family ATPase n=1 Tax=Halosquirtibacter laminarini TaxID=3374600 RepID=A0AC61NN36_9BACT|nr:AAA family ATPase [Prolixibacteraceae bacterium]